MAGKNRLSKKDKEKLTIAVIIISVIIIALCVSGDVIKFAQSLFKSTKDDIGDTFSGVGGIVSATGEVIGQAGGLESFLEGLEDEDLDNIEDALESATDDWGLDTANLVRVVDGDTYILDINGEETRVRLIGVDTPESVAPETYYKENTDEGRLISEIVKERMADVEFFYIEYDVGRTDKYGRTLLYLYFPDGTMVQDWLLENGYADIATYAPNTKYKEHFEGIVAEREAA